jgi:hypothetical protein
VTKAEIEKAFKDDKSEAASLAELVLKLNTLQKEMSLMRRELDEHSNKSSNYTKAISILNDKFTFNARNYHRLKERVLKKNRNKV